MTIPAPAALPDPASPRSGLPYPGLPYSGLPRPALAWRVGVTGARDLATRPAQAQAEIRRQVRAALAAVRDAVAAAGRDPPARAAYADAPPRLRLLSPLAEGADRVVAEIAAELGYGIDVALPFARAEYARDFADPDSRAAFDRWLGPEGGSGARPYLALDGGRGPDETASYEAVGRLVVRNCDLLVAVWDGLPARGRGGTGDIVRFAVGAGVPVWWIDAAGAGPSRALRRASDLRAPPDAPRGADGPGALVGGIGRALAPVGRPPLTGQGAAAESSRDEPPRDEAPPGEAPHDEPTAYWAALCRAADRVAAEREGRARSVGIQIALLAGAGAACAGAAAVYPLPGRAATALTAVAGAATLAAAVLALSAAGPRGGRREAFRPLADLCRAQGALAALGWSLPPPGPRRASDAGASPEPWIAWYFGALVRAAPPPRGDLAGTRLAAARDRARAALTAGRERGRPVRAGWVSAAALASAAVAGASLALPGSSEPGGAAGHADIARGLAAVFGAAAAAFGVRAWAGPGSRAGDAARAAAVGRIDRLDLARPLASQDLAASVADACAATLRELAGRSDRAPGEGGEA